jgi:hypothetical protein
MSFSFPTSASMPIWTAVLAELRF